MMKILFLTGLFPKSAEDEIIRNSKTFPQNAANKLQWSLVNGFDMIPEVSLEIVNSLYIGAYPRKYKKMFIPTFRFSHNNESEDINAGFCNFPFIKIFSRYFSAMKWIRKWIKKNPNEEIWILAYAMTMPFVKVLKDCMRYHNVNVCLVVPDLPEYMNVAAMNRRGRYSFMKSLEIKYMRHCLKNINNYVLLTKEMSNWFDRKINYVVVEGIASDSKTSVDNSNKVFQDGKKHIVYTGGIKEEYNVLTLAECFKIIDNDEWVLDFFGAGADDARLSEIAKGDSRIVCHGAVSNSIAVQAQHEAELLINPRLPLDFTKYSFPSKILEYMGSGTPMVGYKLKGIPDEYDPYYYHIQETDNGMFDTLEYVMKLPAEKRNEMGKNAREFVRIHKNPEAQVKKIVQFFMEINK